MNDNAKKWVAALRSGEFKQTKGFLKTGVGHCCLGVACEVYQREVGGLEEITDPNGFSIFDGYNGALPVPPRIWLGLSDGTGAFFMSSKVDSLAERNDEGATFSEIADLIESEPEGLFVHSASAKPDEMNPSEVSS